MAAAFPSAAQLDRANASRPAHAETPVIANARFWLAEDYHQKYYLRHHVLMAEFRDYSPAQFVDSTVAARLNAYAAGHPVDLRELGITYAGRPSSRPQCG